MSKDYIGSYTLQDFNDTTFFAEYSTTGLEGSWHSSFQTGDLFMRTKTGENSWSQAIRIVGEDGVAGQNGSYVEYQFAKNTNSTTPPTTGWVDSPPAITSSEYLWMRMRNVDGEGASTDWSTATRISGEKGPQGIQGPPGEDGQTLYTWIKYADTPTSGMSDFPDDKEYIGLAYNQTTATESTNYDDYSWSLIKGADGIQGAAGTDGQTTYTWVKYADTATGTGMSDSPVGKRYLGLAFNKTTTTESNTASDYNWSPLYDNVQVGGRNLLQNSGFVRSNSNFILSDYPITEELQEGEIVTFSMKAVLGGTKTAFSLYNSGSTGLYQILDSLGNGVYQKTFAWSVTGSNSFIRIHAETSVQTGESTILRCKLERGNVSTDWEPSPQDINDWITNSQDNIAMRLGYENYSDLVDKAMQGKTLIEGGYINTQLLDANAINANIVQIGSGSNFADGYDPTTKTTLLDVEEVANAAKEESQNSLAAGLGYTDYSDMLNRVVEGQTIIQGGFLNTGLIEAHSINSASGLIGDLTADSITSGTLSSVNKNSWINLNDGTFDLGGVIYLKILEGDTSPTFSIDFSKTNLEDRLDSQQSEINSLSGLINISSSGEGLVIGRAQSDYKIVIDDDDMNFQYLGESIASISGDKMTIRTAEITNNIIIGHHKIEKYSNGQITLFKYIGGNI